MKTAIAMCVYNAATNGASHLIDQLESLRRQTLQADCVVIQDDNSSDDTVALVRQFIEENNLDSWIVKENEQNLGFASNFHSVIMFAASLSDVVFFCDQDDIWDMRKIETMLPILESRSDIELLCHEYEPVDSEGQEIPNWGTSGLLRTGTNSIEQVIPKSGGAYIWLGWTMALRSKFLQRADGYWFEGWAHDEWVWKCSQAIGGCYILHRVLGKHCIHGNNATGHKVHDVNKRVIETEKKYKGDLAAYRLAVDSRASNKIKKWFALSAKCEELRLGLLRDRKLLNAVNLIRYLPYYQAKRSWLVELLMAIRG